jgi:hypothetical protein
VFLDSVDRGPVAGAPQHIKTDLRMLGVEPPAGEVIGLDSRRTEPRLRSP